MYEYDKKSFAQILSELRRTAGLSQRKAAHFRDEHARDVRAAVNSVGIR